MIKASCPPGGVVLDPFMGSGTTALAALKCRAQFAGFELNADYCRIANERLDAWRQEDLFALAGTAERQAAQPNGEANV